MPIERWRPKWDLMRSPFQEFGRMEDEMERVFGRLFRGWPWRAAEATGWAPAVDMTERDDEIVLRADLPGLEQKDIEVNVHDGMITVKGERKEEREAKEKGYHYSERSFGAFVRTLPLPSGIDADKVRATFKNGVLEVHVPRTRESKGKKIEVKAA